MTPIERQILENQKAIMVVLQDKVLNMGIIEVKVKETSDLLNPIKEKEPCCEMPEDMLELKTGRKMGMSSMGINIGKFANARRGEK